METKHDSILNLYISFFKISTWEGLSFDINLSCSYHLMLDQFIVFIPPVLDVAEV